MDGYTYFKICDDLLDNEVSLYDCKKEIASINSILISIFKLHSNDELINIYRKASKIYDENNRLELRMFMSIFSKYIRNSKKKVYKIIINDKDLVISLGRFDSYTLYEYIVINIELYNNDYKRVFNELNIKNYEKKAIYDLNCIFCNKIDEIKNDLEKYKLYINILKILNKISPYYYTEKAIKEFENNVDKLKNSSSSINVYQYYENEKNITKEEYEKEKLFQTIDGILEKKPYCTPFETSASLFFHLKKSICYIFERIKYVYKIVDYFCELEKLYVIKKKNGDCFCYESSSFVLDLYKYCVKHDFEDCKNKIYNKIYNLNDDDSLNLKDEFLNYILYFQTNSIYDELDNKNRLLPSPLVENLINNPGSNIYDIYIKDNFYDFLNKIKINSIYIQNINIFYTSDLKKIKPLFVRMNNNEIIRYGVMNYRNIDSSPTFRFKLPCCKNQIIDSGTNIYFYILTKDKKLYFANDIDDFSYENIENIFTILYDEFMNHLIIYCDEKKIFSKLNAYSLEIVDLYNLEYFESKITTSGEYVATCINLLNMTFNYKIKFVKIKNRYANKILDLKKIYKLSVKQSFTLDYLIFLDYIKDKKIEFQINNDNLVVFLESNCNWFFEVISLYAYLYYERELTINNIDGIDVKYIFEMNECMKKLDFGNLTYLFKMHGKENYDLLLNLNSFTGLFDSYTDSFELLNLISIDKNNICFKHTSNNINVPLNKIKKIVSYYSDLEKSKGHFVNWKSEYHLYLVAKSFYNDTIYQYRNGFLGQQSLDIYIPCLNVGIEYQGIQHFKDVEYFGGNLEERIKLDKIKKEKCLSKGIKLIYWNYDLDINNENFIKVFKDNNIDIYHNIDSKFLLNWKKNDKKEKKKKKVIAQYDMKGNLIKTYNSSKEAAKELKISEVSISYAITGKTISANNYLWRKYIIPDEKVCKKIKLPIELFKIKIVMKNGDNFYYENVADAAQKLNIKKDILLKIINKENIDIINTIQKIEVIKY